MRQRKDRGSLTSPRLLHPRPLANHRPCLHCLQGQPVPAALPPPVFT